MGIAKTLVEAGEAIFVGGSVEGIIDIRNPVVKIIGNLGIIEGLRISDDVVDPVIARGGVFKIRIDLAIGCFSGSIRIIDCHVAQRLRRTQVPPRYV